MESLIELGFTKQDLLLIVLCPLFAVLGGFVHFILLDTNFEKIPKSGGIHKSPAVIGRMHWMMGRFVISFALGLIFAL